MANQVIEPPDTFVSQRENRGRDIATPIVLGVIGIIELGWIGLLGWAALWIAGY
jgi:hypothetical protein